MVVVALALYILAAVGYALLQLSEVETCDVDDELLNSICFLSLAWPIAMPVDALLSWVEENEKEGKR